MITNIPVNKKKYNDDDSWNDIRGDPHCQVYIWVLWGVQNSILIEKFHFFI